MHVYVYLDGHAIFCKVSISYFYIIYVTFMLTKKSLRNYFHLLFLNVFGINYYT